MSIHLEFTFSIKLSQSICFKLETALSAELKVGQQNQVEVKFNILCFDKVDPVKSFDTNFISVAFSQVLKCNVNQGKASKVKLIYLPDKKEVDSIKSKFYCLTTLFNERVSIINYQGRCERRSFQTWALLFSLWGSLLTLLF